MKRKLDLYLNRIFKTPYFLELSGILIVITCNVMTAFGVIIRIEIYRRSLQALFSKNGQALLFELFILILYEILYCGITQFGSYQTAKMEGNILLQLTEKILSKNGKLLLLGNCPMGANDRFAMTSEDCSRYVSGIMLKASVFADIIIMPCYILYGCSINVVITILITVISIVLSIVNSKNRKKLYNYNQEYSERYGYWSNYLWKTVDNLEVIKVFLDKEKIRKEQSRRNELLSDTEQRRLKTYLDVTLIEDSSDIVFTLFILCGAFFAMARRLIQASDILAIVESLDKVQKVIFTFPEKLVQLNELESLAEKIRQFQVLEEDVSNSKESGCFNKLSLRQLSFSYANKRVLNNIDFEFEKEKFYILAGESGCGKTTLLKILAKLIPYEGEIYWNESELKEISRDALYARLFYQSQNQVFLEDTIRENICINSSEDEKRYEKILEEFYVKGILEKNNMEDTQILSFRGEPLSSGERQIVSMAGVLYGQREILLLDEAFSAVDPAKEKVFFEALTSLAQKGKMVILVSHRLTNLELADEILFMENGKISEQGSWYDLIARRGMFYDWYCMTREGEGNDG